MRNRYKFAAVVIFCFGLIVFASEAAKPQLPEVSKLRLVASYQHAVIAQVNAQAAQKTMNDAIAAYNALVQKEITDNKFPAGTSFQINVDSQEVLIILPSDKATEKK